MDVADGRHPESLNVERPIAGHKRRDPVIHLDLEHVVAVVGVKFDEVHMERPKCLEIALLARIFSSTQSDRSPDGDLS